MDIEKILSEMTLEEKAALCQGADLWHTVGCERLGVPPIMVADGPHGLRKEIGPEDSETGEAATQEAVCFPSAAGTATSFDPELMADIGACLSDACQGENVQVLLGPAANIKRSPLCGRNFEYISEDPFLAGKMAAGIIRGIQNGGTGTSLKHFAANNQETHRFSINETISERALREIYLSGFETAVKEGKPWTIMCSYNKINGTYSSENPWLLTEILRDEWGYDGMVMSDWWAVNDHVKSVAAGLELQMPRNGDMEDAYLARAVREGRLPEAVLDRAARRVLKLTERCLEGRREDVEYDRGMQHHMARKAARQAMVLLKNEGDLLPIRGNRRVAFIGDFAANPRYQGGGSSHIEASEVLTALDAVRSVSKITYARGFDAEADTMTEAQLAEAVTAAKEAEIAVLFLGLPEVYESEGYDRAHMSLPACQIRLLEAVADVREEIVVVLHNGSPVEMPWIGKVPALLEAYLGGQAAGGAVVDLLFGAVSPCGKLAETFPLKLSDTPCALNYPGHGDQVMYGEGIYVGYRYYDKMNREVLFPFGHGLTYTTFDYSDLKLDRDVFRPGEELKVSVRVTNTGNMAAAEIVQFYVRSTHEGVDRPVRELKGFGKIFLQPGETGTVTVTLNERSFACWETAAGCWYAEPGAYLIEAAASSRDIRLSVPVTVENAPLKIRVTADTCFEDLLKIPGAAEVIRQATGMTIDPASVFQMSMPLHYARAKTGGRVDWPEIRQLVNKLNQLQK